MPTAGIFDPNGRHTSAHGARCNQGELGMSFDLRNTRLAFVGGLLAIVGGALVGGCGPSSPYAYPDQASFCSALAEATCSAQLVTACYGSNPMDQASVAADTESCVGARSQSDRCNPL